MSQARIGNLPPELWTPEVEETFPILVPPGAQVKGSDFNSLLVLAHHPKVAAPYQHFTAAVSRGVTISAALREVAILRVAWRCRCQYEWTHHVIGGAGAGLGPLHFRALQQADLSDELTAQEQAVARAADDICLENAIGDETWAQLSDHFDSQQLIELILLIGCFQANAAFLNSVRVALEPPFLAIMAANDWPLLAIEGGFDAARTNNG